MWLDGFIKFIKLIVTGFPSEHSMPLQDPIDEGGPELVERLMSWTAMSLVLLLVWAAWAKLDDVSRSSGMLVARGNNAVVQHSEGGMLKRLLVHEGQLVKAGQTLIELDENTLAADLATVVKRREYLAQQVERLEILVEPIAIDALVSVSEAGLLHPIPAPYIHMAEAEPASGPAMGEGWHASTDPQTLALLERKRMLRQGVATAAAELKRQRDLRKQNYATQSRVYAAERDYQGQSQGLAAFEAEMAAQYASALTEHAQQLEQEKKLREQFERLLVRAPVNGTVQGLRLNTDGATVPAGTTLMEIIPEGAPLEALLRLSPNYVGLVREGQPVVVRITAYDASHFGTLHGTVGQISADALMDERGQPSYQVWVKIPQSLSGARGEQVLKPGMVVVAGIVTGQHTVLDYLLRPIRNALDDLKSSS